MLMSRAVLVLLAVLAATCVRGGESVGVLDQQRAAAECRAGHDLAVWTKATIDAKQSELSKIPAVPENETKIRRTKEDMQGEIDGYRARVLKEIGAAMTDAAATVMKKHGMSAVIVAVSVVVAAPGTDVTDEVVKAMDVAVSKDGVKETPKK